MKHEHPYSVLVETPEWKFFEWQVKCAKMDHDRVANELKTHMTSLNLINSLHMTLSQISRQYTRIQELVLQSRQRFAFVI
jgi:hypothetical protein